MYLLIDVRTSSLRDMQTIAYAEYWASLWSALAPHDQVTFLGYEGDEILSRDAIFLPRKKSFFTPSLTSHDHGPSRIVSFSRFPTLDERVPTVLFLDHIIPFLYPDEGRSWIERQHESYLLKKHLKHVQKIIVSDERLSEHMRETYRLREDRIMLLPPLVNSSIERDISREQETLERPKRPYIIVEWSEGDEWRPYELLALFARYIHDRHGILELRILGNTGNHLWHLVSMIRSLDLMEHVKVMGVPTRKERELLYRNAHSWIDIGHESSTLYSLSLALGTGLSLILSDIPLHRGYSATYIHPNHMEELPDILIEEEKKILPISQKNANTELMKEYRRIIIGETTL